MLVVADLRLRGARRQYRSHGKCDRWRRFCKHEDLEIAPAHLSVSLALARANGVARFVGWVNCVVVFCRWMTWLFSPAARVNFTSSKEGLLRKGVASRENPNGSSGRPSQDVSILSLAFTS